MTKPLNPINQKRQISLKQKAFCELFASDREFFGNGVQSYIEAFNIDINKKGAYNSAKARANKLLTKDYILVEINKIFEARGLNDAFVDKQLEKLITQDADFSSKIRAIQEYNKLKDRIANKLDVTSKGQEIGAIIVFEDKPEA